jgi:hypothetical protein
LLGHFEDLRRCRSVRHLGTDRRHAPAGGGDPLGQLLSGLAAGSVVGGHRAAERREALGHGAADAAAGAGHQCHPPGKLA